MSYYLWIIAGIAFAIYEKDFVEKEGLPAISKQNLFLVFTVICVMLWPIMLLVIIHNRLR